MDHLDLQVVRAALLWLNRDETIWFCTVLSTFGSAPREPGALLVAKMDGNYTGSLSGGCVEEDFLERISGGQLDTAVLTLKYGQGGHSDALNVTLPCGGTLHVLVERILPTAKNISHFEAVLGVLEGQQTVLRQVDLSNGEKSIIENVEMGPRVQLDNQCANFRIGPVVRLVIAGISSVSLICAQFAQALGFEVIVCDPREEVWGNFNVPGIELKKVLPSSFISMSGSCHPNTAVVALTHDPRIDDLAMMEAVRTSAFYIGVMGSSRTSAKRAERLRRIAQLSDDDIDRIHMPIGLNLGSKTPAEIALAVMADILRVRRGVLRDSL